jgi:hypothetical protein
MDEFWVNDVMQQVQQLSWPAPDWTALRLGLLSYNIGIAAMLCAAFWQGHEQREHEQLYSNHGYRECDDWYPGHALPNPADKKRRARCIAEHDKEQG